MQTPQATALQNCILKQGTPDVIYFAEDKVQGEERNRLKGPEFLNSLGSSEIRGTSVAIQKLFEEFEDVFREKLLACSMPHLPIIEMESLWQKGLIQPSTSGSLHTKDRDLGAEGEQAKGPEFLNGLGSSETGVTSTVLQKILEELEDVFRKKLLASRMPR
jgi:hypothetical protein